MTHNEAPPRGQIGELITRSVDGNVRLSAGVTQVSPSLFKLFDSKEDGEEAGSMPRQLRREFAGAIYHVTNRGDRREEIFRDKQDHRLLREEVECLGWDVTALRQTAKGDKRKARMAARLRRVTTMSLKWIADNLAKGSWPHVSNLLGAKINKRSLKSEADTWMAHCNIRLFWDHTERLCEWVLNSFAYAN